MEEVLQRAVLVGVNVGNEDDFAYSMEELTNLAEACDVEVIGQVTQNLQRVNPSHYIGKGKIEEVAAYVQEIDANMVIFNDELSPSQIRNLEEDLDCKVIDRTILILDIFCATCENERSTATSRSSTPSVHDASFNRSS